VKAEKQPARPPAKTREEEFPSLAGTSSPRPTSEPLVRTKHNPPRPPAKPSQPEKVDDFPSLPVSSRPLVPSASGRVTAKKQTVIKPAPAPAPPQNSKKPQKKPEKSKFSDEEDDYPSLATTSIQLNNFSSRKTVQSSGQDLAYSSAQISSNIKTIDKSFLESQSSSNNPPKPAGKVKMNSAMDFPDLGRPQQTLDLTLGKKNPSKKQNKKKAQDNVTSQKDQGKTSLNSICEFLHDGVSGTRRPSPSPSPSPSVVPLSGVGTREEIHRPSKLQQNNNQPHHPVKTSKPPPQQTEDFPSLGKASKKIGRTFVSAEEKKQMSAPSMWNKAPAQKENIAQTSQAPQKTVSKKVPPGFGNRKRTAKYCSPADFQERNFALITTITDILGGKSLEFKTFKDISGKFRNGQMGCSAYFSQCKELIEESKFCKIFPDLLSLLPDIEKQQDLFRLYQLEPWRDMESLTECELCCQISLKKDGPKHAEACQVADDFPQL